MNLLFSPGVWRTIVCGGVGGVSLWVAIFPADVCKSRIQVQSVSGKAPTFRYVFMNILRNEGTIHDLNIQ